MVLEEVMPQIKSKNRPSIVSPPWSGEKIYFRGDDYYRDLLRSISKAKRYVEFETYIFEAGWLGDRLVASMARAVKRGVRVRLLVDGVGSPDFASHYGPRLEKAGILFRIYRSWPVFFSNAFRLIRFTRLWTSLGKVHALWTSGKHRDHRKLCVVDGREVWIGSFNVSDWHVERIRKRETWRDTGLRLSGVTTLVFRMAFLIAWEDPWPSRRRRKYRNLLKRWVSRDVKESPVRVTLTRKLRIAYRWELEARFQAARRRLWVITPYFIPTRYLLKAMREAARRGCDVRLILPGISDVPMVRWASMAYYAPLMRDGCRIFEYQKSILHAKTLFVDDWILVGSSNLDQRSLRKDLEVNVIPQSPQTRKALEKRYLDDELLSREITKEDLLKRTWWERLFSWWFFQFRSWF